MKAANGTSGIHEWRLHWTMLLPSTLGVMLCSIHNYSLGVMIPQIESEFGWTRAQISSGPFIIALIALVAAPLVGVLLDKVGPRRIALPGVLFFCTTLALISTSTSSIWSWWFLWLLVGLSAMTVIPSIWTLAINSLFDVNRGKALAVALCGTSLGAALMPPLTNYLVEHHGWRGAYVGLAAILVVIVFPATHFFFRSALDNRRKAVASGVAMRPAPVARGMTAREGFASLRFYQLAATVILFSTAICGITANATPIFIANGLTPAHAAAVAGLMGIGSLIGRLAGGILLDRWDAKKVAALSVLTPAVTVGLLVAFPGSVEAGMAAALILGLAMGTELDAIAYLAARHFGLRSLGTLYGTINGLMLFANGLAPMLANFIFDMTDSYHLYLWLTLPAFLATALIFLSLGKYPDFPPPALEPVDDGAVEPLPGAPLPARG